MKGFMYYVAYIVCFFLIKIPGKVKVLGRENIPKNGNFIIVANHISLWDPWIIGFFMPITNPVNWLTIEMLYDHIKVRQYIPKKLRNGVIGNIVARFVVFTINHTYTIKVAMQSYEDMADEEKMEKRKINHSALRKANKVLKQPRGVVGIFAQRGRNKDLNNASSSCLLLAHKNNVPILPIHLSKRKIVIMKPEHINNSKMANKKDRDELLKKLMLKILYPL